MDVFSALLSYLFLIVFIFIAGIAFLLYMQVGSFILKALKLDGDSPEFETVIVWPLVVTLELPIRLALEVYLQAEKILKGGKDGG